MTEDDRALDRSRGSAIHAEQSGRGTFEFTSSVQDAFEVGGFVLLKDPRGTPRLFGQVTDAEPTATGAGRGLTCLGRLLATRRNGRWDSAHVAMPSEPMAVVHASADDVHDFSQTYLGDIAGLTIGENIASAGRPTVQLRADGFARHTFLCGQSGSGKTYSTGVLLEQLLLQTELQVVVLDPNSDYLRLGELGPPDDEVSATRLDELDGKVYVFGQASGRRLRVRYGRLPLPTRGLILGLDPLADRDEYGALRRASDRLGTTEHSLHDVFAGLDAGDPAEAALRSRIENLGVLDWSIWAEPDEPPLLDQLSPGWRAAIMDLGGVDSVAARNAIAAAILSGLWDRRHQRAPILIVIDEAHNVCPQSPADHYQAFAVESAINIAAEGRKYGLYLLVASQRPQKVHTNVLSQCENLMLMRMNSQADLDHLSAVFSSVPRAMVQQAQGFAMGEGLAAGRIAPAPMLFRSGRRRSPEGGSDIRATWARRR